MMKHFLCLLIFLILLLPAVSAESPKITLVANSIDLAGAGKLISFLEHTDHTISKVNASEFESHKNDTLILILGGPRAPAGIGPIVNATLSEDETSALVKITGGKNFYLKRNVWKNGQNVIVIAGFNRNDTRDACFKFKEDASEAANYSQMVFEVKENINVSLSLESVTIQYDGVLGYYFLRQVQYSITNNGNTAFEPTIDLKIFQGVGSDYSKEVHYSSDITTFIKPFAKNSHWLDTIVYEVKLNQGKYKAVLYLRRSADPEILAQSEKLFTVG